MWKEKDDICCGNCKHHKSYNYKGVQGEWYCDNQNSVNYSVETEYSDECEDFEERTSKH